MSYTSVDRAWAEWIAWHLEDAGYTVLVQAWDFIPGSHWTSQMDEGIRGAERTLAVVSSAYLTSVYGRKEWEAALREDPEGLARRLVPVRIEDCARPGLLGGVVSFDLFGLSAEDARTRLLEQIGIIFKGRAKPVDEPFFPGDMPIPRRDSPPVFPSRKDISPEPSGGGGYAENSQISIIVLAKKQPLQFLIKNSPVIAIDGLEYVISWGVSNISLLPGWHHVAVYFKYLGTLAGRAEENIFVCEGMAISYQAPLVVTNPGKLYFRN